MEIAPGIRRLGVGLVNVYLLEDGGAVTVVDTGLPGYYEHELPAELRAMGRSIGDIRVVLLTHAHSDHLGFAEKIRARRKVPVWIHEADAALARGETKPLRDPAGMSLGSIRPVPLLRFLAYGLVRGGLRTPPVVEVATFGDGATLDVPGSPRVIMAPGHTAGSAALVVESRDAIFAGDVIATRSVLSGRVGPQLAPFGADLKQAFDSLERLDGAVAGLVLPGHGEPWRDGVASALARVRDLGRPTS